MINGGSLLPADIVTNPGMADEWKTNGTAEAHLVLAAAFWIVYIVDTIGNYRRENVEVGNLHFH